MRGLTRRRGGGAAGAGWAILLSQSTLSDVVGGGRAARCAAIGLIPNYAKAWCAADVMPQSQNPAARARAHECRQVDGGQFSGARGLS
jgi:hypothetical protein